MSFWQRLYETGCKLGSYEPEDLNFEFPLLHHAIGKADAVVELDKSGTLISAQPLAPNDRFDILYGVTAESMKRTSDARLHPHALCDNPANMGQLYVDQLEAWEKVDNNPYLAAILTYMKSGTFQDDMERNGISDKARIAWRVNGLDQISECWRNGDLMRSWAMYQSDVRMRTASPCVCMITGETAPFLERHPKALLSGHANGKLISSVNDKDFVFMGRFQNAEEALTVGDAGSHYAHQAFKWLFARGGVSIGNGNYLCIWSPDHPLELPAQTVMQDATLEVPFVWEPKSLKQALFGQFDGLDSDHDILITVIAGGLTKGRDSISSYQEGVASDVLNRLARWTYECAWESWDKETGDFRLYSPGLPTILRWAFGSEQKGRMEVNDSKMTMWLERLIDCKVWNRPLPREIVHALAARANRSVLYGPWLITVALAVLRKHYMEKGDVAVEYTPTLDVENSDRNYLFGRLLAVYQRYEEEYLYARNENRTTQAMRSQEAFARNPYKIAPQLEQKAKNIWAKKLSQKRQAFFDRLLTELWQKLQNDNREACLEASYLFGYYAQRQEFFKKK